MNQGPPYREQELAELLRMLSPAPYAWVSAASELPRIRRAAEQILALAEADADFRQSLIEDLEAALTAADFDPDQRLIDEVEARLATGRSDESGGDP
jgi:hypothetical protein